MADPLAEFIQALPQELYDHILDLTFTPDDAEYVRIRQNRFPHLLHVNRKSREIFAHRYYPTRIFRTNNQGVVIPFLRLLPEEHLELTRSIELLLTLPEDMTKGMRQLKCRTMMINVCVAMDRARITKNTAGWFTARTRGGGMRLNGRLRPGDSTDHGARRDWAWFDDEREEWWT